jgi:hypothetical protein
MNLARLFKAGNDGVNTSRRVATHEIEEIQSSLRDGYRTSLFPALKRRAKFRSTLRVENTLIRSSWRYRTPQFHERPPVLHSFR